MSMNAAWLRMVCTDGNGVNDVWASVMFRTSLGKTLAAIYYRRFAGIDGGLTTTTTFWEKVPCEESFFLCESGMRIDLRRWGQSSLPSFLPYLFFPFLVPPVSALPPPSGNGSCCQFPRVSVSSSPHSRKERYGRKVVTKESFVGLMAGGRGRERLEGCGGERERGPDEVEAEIRTSDVSWGGHFARRVQKDHWAEEEEEEDSFHA